MEGFQCILTIKLYLIRILKKNRGRMFQRIQVCRKQAPVYILVTLGPCDGNGSHSGFRHTSILKSRAQSSNYDAECGMAADGTKTVWALTAYREPSGDMSLCHCVAPVRSISSAETTPVKSSLKSLYSEVLYKSYNFSIPKGSIYICINISRNLLNLRNFIAKPQPQTLSPQTSQAQPKTSPNKFKDPISGDWG